MKFIGIIPARYASTRFPAKPLAILGGKPVIQRVYEQVAGILDEAYVATDDERIESAVKAFGGKVVMTSVHHKSAGKGRPVHHTYGGSHGSAQGDSTRHHPGTGDRGDRGVPGKRCFQCFRFHRDLYIRKDIHPVSRGGPAG